MSANCAESAVKFQPTNSSVICVINVNALGNEHC